MTDDEEISRNAITKGASELGRKGIYMSLFRHKLAQKLFPMGSLDDPAASQDFDA
jgi:hypothetical protein